MASTILKTPIGRLSFPSLFKPKPNDNGGEPKYEATLIFPSGTDLSAIEAEIERVATAKWGAKKSVKMGKMKSYPIKSNEKATNSDGEIRAGYEDQEGFHVQFKSTTKPVIVGFERDPENPAKLLELTPDQIWAGCWAKASYTMFAGEHETGGPYVYVQLHNLQKVKDGEPFAGIRSKAEDDFADEIDPAVLAALA